MNNQSSIDQYRYFLKDSIRQQIDFSQMDQLLRIDGNDEFVIYLAPVGKI